MNNKKVLGKIYIVFFVSSLVIIAALLTGVGYSLVFLSNNLLHAFSTDATVVQPIVFDIEGFNKLGL